MSNVVEFSEYSSSIDSLKSRLVVGIPAIFAGLVQLIVIIIGPLFGLNIIQYHFSDNSLIQQYGQEIVGLVLVVPALIIGGILWIKRAYLSTYLLAFASGNIIYNGFTYGLFNDFTIPGNSERFSLLFISLINIGLFLVVTTYRAFNQEKIDYDKIKRKQTTTIVIAFGTILALFLLLWLKQIFEVMVIGTTNPASVYEDHKNGFWLIKFLDLGIVIPLGLYSTYLLWKKSSNSFPLLMLLFSFFASMISAVFGMAITQFVFNDPSATIGGGVIFGLLTVITWIVYIKLIQIQQFAIKEKKENVSNVAKQTSLVSS
ncbi:MAG: hypothetical protein ACTSQE_14010 [Candidatus Heimdallarchaeaceae archaeon]